jgi:hypothetical protein
MDGMMQVIRLAASRLLLGVAMRLILGVRRIYPRLRRLRVQELAVAMDLWLQVLRLGNANRRH